jgi:hypothetical protein
MLRDGDEETGKQMIQNGSRNHKGKKNLFVKFCHGPLSCSRTLSFAFTFCIGKHSDSSSTFHVTVCDAICGDLSHIKRCVLCGIVVKFLATDPELRARFPALPDFLRSSESGRGSTQPRDYS